MKEQGWVCQQWTEKEFEKNRWKKTINKKILGLGDQS